jgi:type II secretory pathway component PulF
MKVLYKGYNGAGQAVSDIVEARDPADAIESLRRQGIFAIDAREAPEGAHSVAAGARGNHRVSAGRRLKNLAIFTRQLFVLVSTGTPLAQSLGALERQAPDLAFRGVVADLRSRVEEGASLSAAMQAHPEYFDAVDRSLVAAGESAGNLPAMLDRLATLIRKQLHVRSSIIGATVYPCLLIVVAFGVLATLLTFVLPRFTELFKTLDTPLPPTTKILMSISSAFRAYWWGVIPVACAAGFGLFIWTHSSGGKRLVDTIALRIPQIGGIVKSFSVARIARLLGILLQGRVPLTDALELTRDSCANHLYAALVTRAIDAVTRGESLAGAFADPQLVPPSVHEALLSGERSGQLATLLNTMADFMDEANELTVRSLTSILEPMILIVLGVLVGFVALSLFMPLFDLTAATRGG